MTTTTVEYVYFEDAPFVNRTRHVTRSGASDAVDVTEIADDYAVLPAPFLDALRELLNQQDTASCGLCGTGVGFVLRETPAGGERPEWTPTGIAREVGRDYVAALCEVCTPHVPTAEEAQAAR